MSDFTSPPRGRGRHWQDPGSQEPTRYEAGRVDTSGFLPRIEEPTPDELVDSNPGLYRVPVSGQPEYPPGPAVSQTRMNRPTRRPVLQEERRDLVVPRVYLEPDEQMDRLRARSLRWAIGRDIVVIIAGGFLIVRWMIVPLWLALGF